MKKYLRALIQSFYNPEMYREVIVKWQGLGMKYMAFVAAVLAIILAIGLYISLASFEKTQLPIIAKQIPEMKIDDGIVTVPAKQPIVIQSPAKDITITVDTKQSPEELRKTSSQLAIGADFILLRDKNNGYQQVDLKKIKGQYEINEQNIYSFFTMFKFVALPLLWLGQAVNLVVKMMIVTFLSYVVTAFMREEYDLMTRMRLSILALTPSLLITTAVALAINHEIAPWFYMLLSCLYLYVMIVLMRRLPPLETNFSTTV